MIAALRLRGLACAVALVGLICTCPEAAARSLFESHIPLDILIEAPFSKINNDRRDDPEYQEGKLTYTLPDGESATLDIKLKTRGIFRRQRDTCDFPPLRLNFKKKQVAGTDFHGQDKLKLVTHCLRNDDKAQQNVLKEYLAYRVFNQLTDRSFQVRLLNLIYVDTAKRRQEMSNVGFVIEHKEAMAYRNNAEVRDDDRIHSVELNRPHTSLVEMFEYFIGNTDFSMSSGSEQSCCHNMVPISNTPGEYYIVPYDFDFAGLVDPGYAQPNPKLRIRSVRQRLYRGLCRSNGYLEDTLAEFNEARSAIYELPQEIPGLSERNKKSTMRFFDSFYKTINDQKLQKTRLLDKCRS